MTNVLNPFQPNQPAGTAAHGVAAPAPSRPTAPADVPLPTPNSEAVTLSADAQATTNFLNAARTAPGIDQAAVVKLQAAIQAGTYSVSPNSLAAAIQHAAREQP